MQGGNRQPKIAIKQIGNIADNKETFGGNPQQGRVYDTDGLSPTIAARDYKGPKQIVENLRIRKLTPLECWRLQGFSDEQFYKAKESGVSNSQLYKQAGNAVTVNVVDAIVNNLEEDYDTLINDFWRLTCNDRK